MSLEQAINNLADAINRLAGAGGGEPRQSSVAPGPDTDVGTKRRGRPPKAAAEETTQPAPTQDAAIHVTNLTAEETTGETIVVEPEVKYTIEDVRNALKALRDKDGSPDRAKALMKEHAGVEMVPAIPEGMWATIIQAAKALL